MAILGSELVRMTREEVERLFSQVCGICNQPIDVNDPHPPEIYKGEPAHSDCYFFKLSEEFENYPIGRVHVIPRR
jgi:hypothetical protein